jgi:two-component system cell cycle sensor histidine kinase/response regulator CckA
MQDRQREGPPPRRGQRSSIMTDKKTAARKPMNPWHFVWISVVASELFTALLSLIQVRSHPELPIGSVLRVGAIDALFVPLIVASVVVFFLRSTRALESINAQLQREIDERLQAEAARQASEGLLNAVIQSSADAIFVKDLQGRYVLMNEAWSALTGRDPAAIRGKDDTVLFPSGQAAKIMADDRDIISSARSVMYEHALTMADGDRMLQVRKGPILDKERKVTGIYGIARDITERCQMEDALRSSETRFRTIIENASAGIIVADTDTRGIRYANPEVCRMLGYSQQELNALTTGDLSAPQELRESEETFREHAEGRLHASERTMRRKDGSTLRVSINSVPMEIDGRKCLVGFFSDITERHLLEEERLKTQKLEALGTLAGGIAHDFNNLLHGLFGYLSLARLTIGDRAASVAALNDAEKALNLTVNLTNQLLTFSKGGMPVKKQIDLRPVIENAVRFALSGSRSVHRLFVDDGLWRVEADEGQVAQVIQNIVLNADQSMPQGGEVSISVRNVLAPGPGLPQSLADGPFVEIAISDIGIGISETLRAKIFDPYFSTKGQGSGLGLATCYSIVKNHNGLITVTSEPGKGSTFRVYLPALPAAKKEKSARPAVARLSARAGRVLVMDDDALIRDLATKMITNLGHEVEAAAEGREAVEKYRQALATAAPFDIVILDLTVRGAMGGAEALARLLEIDPRAKVVLSSGYSEEAAASNYQNRGAKAFLKKPYNISDLKGILDSLIGCLNPG